MKAVILVLIVLAAGACAGPHYFDLNLHPEDGPEMNKIDRILEVDDIRTNETFWNRQIVYRKSPYRIQYYPFKYWSKQPGELIQDAVIYYYRNGSFFSKVVDDYSSVEPDLVMKIHIDALEMIRRQNRWHARLALDIEIVDQKTEKTILNHTFDRMERIRGKKPRYLPEKISRILREELVKLVRKIKKINEW